MQSHAIHVDMSKFREVLDLLELSRLSELMEPSDIHLEWWEIDHIMHAFETKEERLATIALCKMLIKLGETYERV